MGEYIIKSVIELTVTVVSVVITSVLLPVLTSWLRSKTQSEILKSVISDISTSVATCVEHCEQTMVPILKADGSWDAQAKQNVRDIVVENVIDNLLATTKHTLEKNEIDIRNLIELKVEAYIQSKKQ